MEQMKVNFPRRRVAKRSGAIPQKYSYSKKRTPALDDQFVHDRRHGLPDRVVRDFLERDSGNSGENKNAI